MCDSLGIEPKRNNGTLRLPLKPVGLHSDKPIPTDDDLPDFQAETSHTYNSPASATESVDPVETDSPNDTAPTEGIVQMKQADVVVEADSSQTRSTQKKPSKS